MEHRVKGFEWLGGGKGFSKSFLDSSKAHGNSQAFERRIGERNGVQSGGSPLISLEIFGMVNFLRGHIHVP